MTGYVYAVECGGRVKIGHSKFPDKRFSKIASDAPFPCVLMGYWPGTVQDELDIHTKFNVLRVHGEWFASTEALLGYIASQVVPAEKQRRFDILETDTPLAVWRKTQGKPMEPLAQAMNVSRATWCRWELGRVTIPMSKMLRIMNLTGLSFEELAPQHFNASPKDDEQVAA